VIGLGLNKTGTTTLAVALGVLGYRRHLSNRRDLLALYRAGDPAPALDAVEQAESCEDWPFPLMHRELLDRFGDRARYVLTTRRDAAAWLASLKAHALRTPPDRHARLLAYGWAYPHGAEAHHLAFYDRHLAEVRAHFRDRGAEHLLLEVCWEAGDGWERLCGFLGLPVPPVPFPHANAADPAPDAALVAANRARIREQLLLLGHDITHGEAWDRELGPPP
jgi:hypothetical protein